MELLQGLGLERGGGTVVGLMSQIVLDTVEADAAGSALVIVCEGQSRKKTAAVSAHLCPTRSFAEVYGAISLWTGRFCPIRRHVWLQ